MKQVLATLEIIIDPDAKTGSSGTGTNDGKNFHMLLKINSGASHDLGNDSDFDFRIRDRKTLQTVIAHELGHFVAMITKDPSHSLGTIKMYQFLQDPKIILPAENLAWEIGEMIYPDLDQENKKASLKSYETY